MIPPWLIPYRKRLNDDGIMDDSDFMYIQDFQFIEWMDNERCVRRHPRATQHTHADVEGAGERESDLTRADEPTNQPTQPKTRSLTHGHSCT